MARYLFLLVFATLFQNSLQSGCRTVRISGAILYQTDLMTTYTMTGQTYDGRPVYQSSRGDYLYYATSDTTWNVGSTVGSSLVNLYLPGATSYYADDTSGTWEVYTGIYFQADSFVSVTGTCTNDRLRLVDGSTTNEGRLEVRPSGSYTWGTVCDDNFDTSDADVACRMLGYSGATGVRSNAYFGQGSGDIYMDDLQCSGYESSLFDCPYPGWGVEDCIHSEDVGIVCGSWGDTDSSGLSIGAIVGIVVGVLVVVVVAGVLACVLCCAACSKSGSVAAAPQTVSLAVAAPTVPPPMYSSGPGYPQPTPYASPQGFPTQPAPYPY